MTNATAHVVLRYGSAGQACEPATSLDAARRRKPLIDLSDEHEKLVNLERRFTNLFLMRDFDIRKGDYATARARYANSFPHLLAQELPAFGYLEANAAIDLALVLQHTGEGGRAVALLDRSEAYVRTIPRMGLRGYGIVDVVIHALRGDSAVALKKLRDAEQAGWRQRWRYCRDFDPNLASIRNEPEFKAVFADIEREMARQRVALSARPKDASLDIAAVR